jgi:hypothetical protein
MPISLPKSCQKKKVLGRYFCFGNRPHNKRVYMYIWMFVSHQNPNTLINEEKSNGCKILVLCKISSHSLWQNKITQIKILKNSFCC